MPDLTHRPRRLRYSANLRRMTAETTLTPADFIAPLFVRYGKNIRNPISSMPGQNQLSVDQLEAEVVEIAELGIPAVILFGIPAHKDALGSENYNPEGIIPQAIQVIKQAVPELVVISDMCFCEYTDHGHCGIIHDGYLMNDETLRLLSQASVVHAQAGADIIAPSGMLDGMVGTIRAGLDKAGQINTSIMSYAVKYASAFYGPFRDAAESPPQFGDRSQYQMNPANAREALTEARLDVEQGADFLMVKPALPYLDILHRLREQFTLPLAAYQVSGEYAMIHAAAQNGWIDLERVMLESLTSIKRAGADMILTYFAKEAARHVRI